MITILAQGTRGTASVCVCVQLFDAIFLNEVSMLPEDVFKALYYHVLQLPKRPILA